MVNKLKPQMLIVIMLCAIVFAQLTIVRATSGCSPIPSEPEVQLDIQADVGSTHFRGEKAEFYALVSLSGNPVDVDSVKADLYYNGTYFANLTSSVQHVSKGLYRIPYNIPSSAVTGTYALEVNACYYSAEGTALKCFLLSQTLTSWNAYLTEIQNTTATIKTDVGIIKVALGDINAKLVSIEDKTVMIESDIGEIKTDIETINLKMLNIQGNIATINTTLGTIQGNITSIQGNILTITTSIGVIQIDIDNLNASVKNVENSILTIQTSIGQIQVNLNQINSTIVHINGTVATIQTNIGTITTT
ncbi:hypothetical protein IMZ68_05895 [Candidatus Bathyarchaeota archaeon]|nr:hypothetical protein [Candidatus Bathyarchaeota archaeon]